MEFRSSSGDMSQSKTGMALLQRAFVASVPDTRLLGNATLDVLEVPQREHNVKSAQFRQGRRRDGFTGTADSNWGHPVRMTLPLEAGFAVNRGCLTDRWKPRPRPPHGGPAMGRLSPGWR